MSSEGSANVLKALDALGEVEGLAMRKTLLACLLVLASTSVAGAEPSGKCGGGLVAVSSNGGAVCVTTGPYRGSTEARTLGGTTFYVVHDGDSTNQALPTNCLDGYVAVQNGGGYTGVATGGNGDYAFGPQAPPGVPTVPPCT